MNWPGPEKSLASRYETDFELCAHFFQEFDLIEKKELAPLQELIDRLTSIGGATASMTNAGMEGHH